MRGAVFFYLAHMETTTPTLPELTYAHWRAEEEREIQYSIIKAREYHDGEQFVYLTDRMREFLNIEEDADFNMNICRGVVEAITEKLTVSGFKCADEKTSEFAWSVWLANGMDGKQVDLHDMTIRDREAFVFVAFDPDEKRVILIPHQRYTDAEIEGDNEGCKATYANDDPNQELLYVSKRWVEYLGGGKTRLRLTVYHKDRIEKYYMVNGIFVQISEEIMKEEGDSEWPIRWVDSSGSPIGIPVVHFINQGFRQEARDAWPMQDAANKTLLDMLAAADLSGFRIYKAFGWIPTSDGEPLEDDQSNALNISPAMIIGSKNPDGSFDAVEASDPTPLINMLQQIIYYAAIVTRTPVSRYQFSGMVAAEGTLKQQQESLLAKVKLRQTTFGSKWSSVMSIARRLENIYGAGGLDDTAQIETLWDKAEPRDRLQELQELQIEKDALNVPLKMLWRKAGYNDQDIEQMMLDREDELAMNLRVSQSDLSTPFVEGANNVAQ